jgi:hypothetical protein
MQRAYGSESMFVAGRIELGEPEPWVALCWLGDSPVAAVDIDGELLDLGPQGHTSERWNATKGVKGEVHSWVGEAQRIARVLGYSDGLGLAHAPTDDDLARLMVEWRADPPNDDASLFDARLIREPAAGLPVPSGARTVEAGEATPMTAEPTPAEAVKEVKTDTSLADTQPIIAAKEERTPVTQLQPIEVLPPGEAKITGWRPLVPRSEPTRRDVTPGSPTPPSDLAMTREQQLRMWQQAALLGLTSAALALLMLDRLLSEEPGLGEQEES